MAPLLTLAIATLVALLQEIPAGLMDLLDTLLRLSALALLVVPVAEVRRLLGGLPDIPLPGGNSIRAGRWFSWLVASGVLAFGHAGGILTAPDWADFQTWITLELAILGFVANFVYDRFWRGQIGLESAQR